jgi:hypothetical protein
LESYNILLSNRSLTEHSSNFYEEDNYEFEFPEYQITSGKIDYYGLEQIKIGYREPNITKKITFYYNEGKLIAVDIEKRPQEIIVNDQNFISKRVYYYNNTYVNCLNFVNYKKESYKYSDYLLVFFKDLLDNKNGIPLDLIKKYTVDINLLV